MGRNEGEGVRGVRGQGQGGSRGAKDQGGARGVGVRPGTPQCRSGKPGGQGKAFVVAFREF